MVETARDGPRPLFLSFFSLSLPSSLPVSHCLSPFFSLFSPSLSLSLSSLLRPAQSVAKQLVCFVRGPSDRLRADNRQTIRRGCFASGDSRRVISLAKLRLPSFFLYPSLSLSLSLFLSLSSRESTGCINSGAIISVCPFACHPRDSATKSQMPRARS